MAALFVSDTPPGHAPIAFKFDKNVHNIDHVPKIGDRFRNMTTVFCMKKILELFAFLLVGQIAMSEKFLDFIIKIEPHIKCRRNS